MTDVVATTNKAPGHRTGGKLDAADDTASPLPYWVVLTTLALLGGVLPIVIAQHFGALGIPRGDDAAYILAAFRFADTGRVTGNHWASMNLVGQLVLALPLIAALGHRIAALQIEVAILGVGGLLAVYDLASKVLTPRRALFAAGLVAVGPLWAGLSASFLTDVPMFALTTACLALGARAITRDRLHSGLLCGSLVLGFLGFTVREYAIIAPVAVTVSAIWVEHRRPNPRVARLVIALGALLAVAAVFLAWRRGLPDFTTYTPKRPTVSSLELTARRAAEAVLQVSLLLAPAVFLAGPLRICRAARSRAPRATLAVASAAVLALGIDFVVERRSAGFLQPAKFNGNQWTLENANHDLFPRAALPLLELVAVFSFIVLLIAIIPPIADAIAASRHGQLPHPQSTVRAIVALAALGFVGAYLLASATSGGYFLRYLLPLLPLLAILLFSARAAASHAATRPRQWLFGVTALVLLAVLGVAYSATNASFDGTKWSVASGLVTSATTPTKIDAGFEWNNYHAGDVYYPWFTHPKRTCIRIYAEEHRPSGARVLRSERVWSVGTEVWVVARRLHTC